MTRAEATTLALQFVGAIGCGAGVSAGLVALDAEDTAALWAAGRIIGVGILALFAADTAQDDRGDGAKRRKRSV
jgi:hypothetical protein